jgi:hypothetical protein
MGDKTNLGIGSSLLLKFQNKEESKQISLIASLNSGFHSNSEMPAFWNLHPVMTRPYSCGLA